ncbi:hypothetical protein COU58_00905 [Candidatus Pacearchaeota archaeon CG10_big_fil_rev_8_21_14_0_10_32_42]|nr:MAG: hypothetical protein COU58_00905 [Candidatus Pacearchaeota archaeon CG10_big_fil_rev_8_21_14_0_10_32_42]
MVMKRNYFVFLQALLLTVVVFIIGFYIGMSVEAKRTVEINDYYTQSEISLVDILALNNLVGSGVVSCSELTESNKELLNRLYDEARTLIQYEDSGKLTNSLKILHKKYDILRTYLWINSIQIKEECGEKFSTIVYLYEYNQKDLVEKAKQSVWSKLLLEIKNENEDVLLIPIAMDSNLSSLNSLLRNYGIEGSLAVIVNEETIFYEIPEKKEIIDLLK